MSMSDFPAVRWRKASRSSSSGGACVELAQAARVVGVRDSKAPGAGHLTLPVEAAATLFAHVKDGALDGRW
ncbi:hypothetical protein BTM25_51560 [Actinomadura rubteroloni]|uniref:DUF397 domain-containing protein n=2 Tax=Actinomadura rubteroloni TaxID=1926885 RepID=A0A2P4UD31_9ACTN|nr:hypothetical protein BTM25_51560 [Actinomadura rubteroloni]